MADIDLLTPGMAAAIATNSYFTLRGWSTGNPVAGTERGSVVRQQVLGKGPATSLRGTAAGHGRMQEIFSGETGLGTTTGFGYVLSFDNKGSRHVVVASRGTRPELGAPDLITDLRAGMTSFAGFGPVHKGFKRTYDSIMPQLSANAGVLREADVLHFVGHSLGGGVATLLAAQYANSGQSVRLYTFGSPRVGAFTTFQSLQEGIGKSNILRMAHDLDPITLIAPFPYIHVNPSPRDPNNITLSSPTGKLFSTANHDMKEYIRSARLRGLDNWDTLRLLARQTDYDNSALVKALLFDEPNPSWLERASVKTLALLFKLFSAVLKAGSTSIILSLSAVDLLAEILVKGFYKIAELGDQVYQLMHYAAKWAGIELSAGADFTAEIVRRMLDAMLGVLRNLALAALSNPIGVDPIPLLATGTWVLTGGMSL